MHYSRLVTARVTYLVFECEGGIAENQRLCSGYSRNLDLFCQEFRSTDTIKNKN